MYAALANCCMLIGLSPEEWLLAREDDPMAAPSALAQIVPIITPVVSVIASAVVAIVSAVITSRSARNAARLSARTAVSAKLLEVQQKWLESFREDLSSFLTLGERCLPSEARNPLVPACTEQDRADFRRLCKKLKVSLGRENEVRRRLAELVEQYANDPEKSLEAAIEEAAQPVFRDRWERMKALQE